jgi:integrase/recombinase XerD
MRQGFRGRALIMRGLWVQPRDGKAYYRTRRGGKAVLIPLPDLPHDHPDFIAAWAEAARTLKPVEKPKAGTIASIWAAAMQTDDFRALNADYSRKLALQAKLICAKGGHVKGAAVKPIHVERDVSDAPDPRARRKAWRFWAKYAKRKGYITEDPTDVALPKMAKAEGHPAWTAEDVAKFRARWPIGSAPRAAMELMHWTGLRVVDAVSVGPQNIGRDGVLTVKQSKTGGEAFIPWMCPLHDWSGPDERDTVRAALAPFAGHLTFLATKWGKTRSPKALATMMQDACKEAGIAVSAHGLRKARAVTLAEHGATPHQIGSWTGHESLGEVARYARSMDRRRAVIGTAPEPKVETGVGSKGNASA